MPVEEEKELSATTADIAVAVAIVVIILSALGGFLAAVFDLYASIVNWLFSGNWSLIYKVAAIVFTILDIALFGFMIFAIRRYRRLDELFPQDAGTPATKVAPVEEEFNLLWREIKTLINSPNPSEWNMAVIRADGMLNDALLRLGYQGETMAERLKAVDSSRLPSIEGVWSAHRLRNTIVHGPQQEYSRETLIQAVRSYEVALKELKILKEL